MTVSTPSKKRGTHAERAVPRILVADAVTDRLRGLILSGEIPDGAPLRQDALAEDMNTSRIPVREALSRLEGEGLVASFPHRGYVVTGLSREEIQELFDLRTLLEPELIRYAIPRMEERDFAASEAILKEFDAAMADGDMHRGGELNRAFHLALYAPAGRVRTLEIVRSLLVNSDRYTRVVLNVSRDNIRDAKEDHRGLLELCRKRLVNQAVALMRDHILRTGDELLHMSETRERPAMSKASPSPSDDS